MLVSVASFLPIIIVGPIADLVGTTVGDPRRGIVVLLSGIASVVTPRSAARPEDPRPLADPRAVDPIAAALGADRPTWPRSSARTRRRQQRDARGTPTAVGRGRPPDRD